MRSARIEQLDDARRLQLLIDGVIDYAIYLISLDGLVVSWNSGAERLKGYRADEIIGRPYETFFTSEDRERGRPHEILSTAARDGRIETEGWRVRKDGTLFLALAVVDAVYDEQRNLIGFAKVTRDITEREASRRLLLESETRFRQLVNAVVDYAIFQLDVNGNVVTWNPGAERIKGYTADEIIGRNFRTFYTEEERRAGVPDRALATAAKEGRFEAEGWRVRKDGTRFWALVVIDPIKNDQGELVGYAKVTRDVTERMRAQKALKDAQEQLAAAQRLEAVGQLSGGIAHDFNNLLMIVIGNLETAQRHARSLSGANSNMGRAISNAMRGAQRAAALTSRLLAFSRRQPLDPKPLDVNKFLNGASEFLQRSLGETVQVQFVGAAGVWPIEADPNHLESALVNLAINARDAMPSGGRITIEATNVFVDDGYVRHNPEITTGQYVLICVSDEGMGMSSDTLSRAFEPFFSTKEPGHGTGLGLSQVYGFVKQSGGHIKIYSEVGQGSTIKIYLPRYTKPADVMEDSEDDSVGQGEKDEAILLVEDDDEVRSFLAEALRSLGYSVITAPNGKTAVAILEQPQRRIDLLLTDVVMPGMTGRDVGNRALELRPGLPILYMTGYSRNAVVHQGRLDEGVELLQKPISQAQLASRIRDALDRAQSGRS